MSKQFSVILVSHGDFAKAALNSVKMICGEQDNVQAFSITMDMDFKAAKDNLLKVYNELDNSNGTLILVDILGGTPSNIACNLALTHENVRVFAGFNLPVLLDLFLTRGASVDVSYQRIKEMCGSTFVDISERLKGGADDANTID